MKNKYKTSINILKETIKTLDSSFDPETNIWINYLEEAAEKANQCDEIKTKTIYEIIELIEKELEFPSSINQQDGFLIIALIEDKYGIE